MALHPPCRSGSYQTELVLSCLAECPSEELEKRIWEKYKIADFVNSMIKHKTRRECLIRLMALSGRVLVQVIEYLKKEGYRAKGWFFENIGRYPKKEHLPLLLEGIQKALRNQDWFVRKAAAQALGALAPHAGKEHLSLLLEGFQTALRDQNSVVRRNAAKSLGALAPHAGKEHLPLLLEGIQKALRNQDWFVRKAAAEATCSLKTECLLSIFVSQPPSCPQLIPLIFEHFINQSIPLYLIENSGGYSIHINDTCYEILHPKQLGLLSNRCTALRAGTWTPESENTQANCILM